MKSKRGRSFIKTIALLLGFAVSIGLYYVFVLAVHRFDLTIKRPPKKIQGTKERSVIVLLSQPRSGSTFLGRSINMLDNMLYLYEPFIPLLRLKHLTNMTNNQIKEYRAHSLSFLKEVLNCRFSLTSQDIIRKVFNSRLCLEQNFDRICSKITSENAKFCSEPRKDIFLHMCSNYKTLFLKMLKPRFSFEIKSLFDLEPETASMRVIYLVRDPRASFWSLLKKGWVSKKFDGHFETYLEARCQEILANLREIQVLVRSKQNILLIRHEDLQRNPAAMISQLSKFLRKTLTVELQSRYQKMIRRENESCLLNGSYVKRENSPRPNWRADASEEFIRSVEKRCKLAMDSLGYKTALDMIKYRNCSNTYVSELENVPLFRIFRKDIDEE